MIIGAYRDEKMDLLQPLMMMKNELIKEKTIISTIKLKALEKNVVELLVKDTLISSKTDLFAVKELAEFIYNKTQGNAFFVKQFLQSIYQKEYIRFDYDLMQWRIDITQIRKLDITENVIELLSKRIRILDLSTREELINAACIGNHFDLKTLALINNKTLDSVMEDLQLAVDEGLITIVKDEISDLSQGNIKFEFLHDRIQQAVYSLTTDEMRQVTHLHIGRLLLKKYGNSTKTEHLFEIVRHLNVAKSIIRHKAEYIKLAELNFKTGMVAKSSSAYKAAFIYFKTGIDMLRSNGWEEYYDLTLKLYSHITAMSYLISDYETMDKCAEIVLKNAKTLTDKIKVYNIKIQAYQAQLKLQEALKIGVSVLELMGIKLPLEPKQKDIEKSFANVKDAMEEMEVEDLLKLPPMSDLIKLATMEIMMSTLPATYKVAPMLTPILTCKMVEFSIKYGNAPFSAGAYVFYGMILCASTNDIENGYRIGRMSINLVESQDLNQFKAKVLEVDNYCIKHWKEHLKNTLSSLTEGFKVGMENGDFEYGAYCLPAHSKNSFYIGRPLNVLEGEAVVNIKILQEIKQGLSLNYEKIFGQLVLNMQGISKNPVILTGKMCDENEMLSIVSYSGDMVGMFFFFLSKTILYYHFGEYFLAVASVKKAEENLAGVAGMVDIAVLHYFDSLSRLVLYPHVSNKEKEEILIKVSQNQVKLKYWSKYAPMNFLHKFYLVEAERLRVMDKTYEAVEYYDKAISMAKKHEYINDESLANELAGKFWFSKNKYSYAKLHIKEAHFGYKRWGAEAKVKDLQNKYLEIFNGQFPKNENKKHATLNILELVDINTIMKASQAISQEIVLDELIKKLIRIIIENVGVQKVVVIMKEAGIFIIKGKKEIEEEKITVVQDTKLSEYDNIPKSILNYVSITNESVILENSIESINFGSDKYIATRKPKSILCFPLINQKELKGIIYLENNLMTGAFTMERLKLLEMLSSQIVISLENANLYEDLERSNEILDNKVKVRTAQLKEERDKLQKYLDIAEVSFLVLDKDEKVVLINRKGCEILGYSEEEILGKKWYENFVEEKYREKIKTAFEKTLNGEVAEQKDVVVVTKTGEERITYSRNTLLRDKEGNVEGTLSCAVDVTEYNILREQLEYNKLKLEFFANLSHELKTPLNLSFCALQMLNLYRNNNVSLEANKKLDKYANIIKQNNYRLLKLVNNIVDITKINSNSFDLILQNHDIVDLIRNITFSVSDYVENKNRILEFNSNIKSKVIACDSFSIERIILNLLSNAIKFTDEGDEISVSIYDKKDSIIIVVKDTGIGIPKEKQNMIFERFRQVDKSFTRNSEGSGIGLTIVKLLTELHHGEITVESTVGEFSKFIINLPVKEIEQQNTYLNNYNADINSLIDRIDIEFSDVYGL
ncbi:MAG: histidine kinase [Clostridium sp.]